MPAAATTACTDSSSTAPSRVRVASLDELEGGEPVDFQFPGVGSCFAVKLEAPAMGGVGSDASIVAFSTLCPHMGCPIESASVDARRGEFGPCRCHLSLFDLRNDGRMLHGRASSSLPRIELEIEGDDVYAIAPNRLAFGQPLNEELALTTLDTGLADEQDEGDRG